MDLEALKKLFGVEFVLYALNVDEEVHLEAGQLAADQQAAVVLMGSVAENVPATDPYREINKNYAIMQFVPGFGMTLPNALRKTCGGTLPAINSDDPLVELILTLARDVWPSFLLLSEQAEGIGSIATSVVHQHEAGKSLLKALVTDADFGRLFPRTKDEASAPNSPYDFHSDVMFSSGSGGTFQPSTIVNTVLLTARARMELSGRGDVLAYLDAVGLAFNEARRLAAGETISITRYTGVASVSFSVARTIETPLGSVRPLRDSDLPYLRQGAPNALQPTAVLETPTQVKVLGIYPWAPGPVDEIAEAKSSKRWERARAQFDQFSRSSERALDALRLAILLASGDEQLLPALPVTIARPTPLQYGNNESHLYQFGQPSGTGEIDEVVADRIAMWANRIAGDRAANLDFGTRRLLSAAAMRWDPVDGFVDAVVSWENMLGASPETTFRLSAAMAWLLEPEDGAKRQVVLKNIKTLYGVRSKIVHGDEEPPPSQAVTLRAEAISLAVKVMRVLYLRPDLLAIEKSQVRGEAVLINGGSRATKGSQTDDAADDASN